MQIFKATFGSCIFYNLADPVKSNSFLDGGFLRSILEDVQGV